MTDAKLITLTKEFRDGILGKRSSDGMCGAICWPLAGYLSALHNIEAEIVEADLGVCNHYWLLLPDGRALDPTADQFNSVMAKKVGPVYLGNPLSIHTRGLEPVTK